MGTTIETRSIIAVADFSRWSESILPSGESLRAVYFSSAANGWVGSASGSLYRTVDEGVSWRRVKIQNGRGNYIISLNFVGNDLGWAAFSKYPSDYSDYKQYRTRVFHTEDGGNSWSPQYEKQQASINRIRFNQNEGWAIGVSYNEKGAYYLVLHTADHGKNWEDISEGFERAISSAANRDFPIDVHPTQHSGCIVLTVGGRVMQTDDAGHAWREVLALEDEFQQTGFMRIGQFENGSLWALGGADSKEGIWALFSVLNKDSSWARYRTTQVFFRDVAFLGERRAVACGAVPDYENPQKVTERRAAIISSSSDGGRSWSIAYRSNRARVLHAIFALDANRIWAVGDKGLIVRLE